jgi:hypothetical protein
MMSEMKDRSSAFIASAAISVFLTGDTIIAHDISGDLRQFLAGLTGHHWTSVSAIAIAIFLITSTLVYILAGSKRLQRAMKAESLWSWSLVLTAITLIMTLGIMAVYVLHYFAA